MSFIYSWFLWALLSLAIPIIIHLFFFRRFQTVYFAYVRFLKEVKEQTAARQKLKHLLVLSSRLLALGFLVLAFCMPFLPENTGGNNRVGARDVSIYVDNSFSMSAETEDVRLFEKARQRAEEIIAAYDPEDKIQILTADFEGRDQRLLSKEDASSRVGELRTSFATRDLSTVLARQRSLLQTGKNPNKEVYIISDFQKNSSQLVPQTDSSFSLFLVPLQSVQNRNVSVDTAWFESPVPALNQPNPLIVRIRNHTNVEMSSVRVSLELDGQARPEGALVIPAQSVVYDTINISVLNTGWHQAKINITDFPVEFDNDYYFSFYVAEQISMLEIFETAPNKNIAASFAQNTYFKLLPQSVNQLDYSKFAEHNLLILSGLNSVPSGLIGELNTYVRNGGNVLIFPSNSIKTAEYNQLAQTLGTNSFGSLENTAREVSFINYEDFVFNDVFEQRKDNLKLPNTIANYRMQRKANEEMLLRYRDGQPFVSKHLVDKGNVYICAAPLDPAFSSLAANGEIFVPMLYRMGLARGQSRPLAYTIGKDNFIETNNRASVSELTYKIGNKDGQEFIPEQRGLGSRIMLGLNNQVQTAGVYSLYYEPAKPLEQIGFNYDRKESELSFLTPAELAEQVGNTASIISGTAPKDFTNLISRQHKGRPLWKYCLIACLFFLLLETLFIRLLKG